MARHLDRGAPQGALRAPVLTRLWPMVLSAAFAAVRPDISAQHTIRKAQRGACMAASALQKQHTAARKANAEQVNERTCAGVLPCAGDVG